MNMFYVWNQYESRDVLRTTKTKQAQMLEYWEDDGRTPLMHNRTCVVYLENYCALFAQSAWGERIMG